MAWRDNPLLEQVWRTQFHLKKFHRSALLFLALLFIAEIWGLQFSFHRDFYEIWFVLSIFAIILIAPLSTLLPLRHAWYAIRNMRKRSQLEPLLVTPISSKAFTIGLMLPAILPVFLFHLGFMVILFLHLPQYRASSVYHNFSPDDWTYWTTLLGTIPYCLVQVFYSVAVTLRLSLRTTHTMLAQIQAVLILVVVPTMGFFLAVFVLQYVHLGLDFEHYLLFEALLMLLKLTVAAVLTAGMRRNFHRVVKIEAS